MQFTHEHRELERTTRRIIAEHLDPWLDEWEAEQMFPAHRVMKAFGSAGLLGIGKSAEYGGMDLDFSYEMVFAETLGEVRSSGLSSAIGVQSTMCTPALAHHGSDALKREYLAPTIAGDLVGCIGVSEASAGSDVSQIKTWARRDGDDYIINGSKMWITNGSVADIAIVWANTDEGVQGFVVEKGTPGFTAQEIKHKMSLRASVTGALFFDNVRVPDANRLPNVKGLKGPLGCLTQARYGITWGPIGAAIACLDEVLAYTKERILFGRPVAATQSAQIKMADMARRITAGQLLVLQLGRLKDAGEMQPQQVSLAKWNNCRLAIDIARECRDLLGGAGITTEHSAIRHALNLESVITYEGTETVHQLVVGRELTGINAF